LAIGQSPAINANAFNRSSEWQSTGCRRSLHQHPTHSP
jgi:hypothetical protein